MFVPYPQSMSHPLTEEEEKKKKKKKLAMHLDTNYLTPPL